MALTDLTRISTSGIATGSTIDAPILRKDVSFHGTQVGVTSALFDSSDNALEFNDNVKIKLGNGGDLELYHTGARSEIINNTGDLIIQPGINSNLFLRSQTGAPHFKGAHAAQVEIYYNGNEKIRTTNEGAVVTGILTATSFSGPTLNTSGIATFYDLRVSNNLTVEGTTTTLDTNLIGVDRVSIGANSNTDTAIVGIQSGTADIVNLFDGTTEVLTVKDGGQVGIGSESPSQKLDVGGAILTRSTFSNTATFSHNALKFQTSGGAHIDHETTNQNLNFRVTKSSTSDTNMMQINAASEQTKFHKVINVGLQGGNDTTQIGGGSGIGAYLQLNYASGSIVNTKLMGNNTSWLNSHYGNLGIGTQTPNAKFVVSNAGANGFEFNPNFNSNNSIIASYNRVSDAYTQFTLSASQIIFSQGGAEYGRFNGSGNLGIGTNNPIAKLEVLDSSYHQSYMRGSSTVGGIRFGNNTYTNGYIYYDNGPNMNFQVGGIERFRINNNGDIQIGTAGTTGTLRYVDIQNTAVGNSAGTIIRLITSQSDETGTTSADIVKYKTGGLIINNNESNGTTGFISFGTAANGGSVTERLRITSTGDINVHNTTAASSTDPVTLDLGGQFTPNASITQANLKLKLYHNGAVGDTQGITASAEGLAFVSSNNTNLIFYTVPNSINNLQERLRITSSGQTIVKGVDDQDNFVVDVASTQFAVHTDGTDGEISLRAQDGSGSNNAKYMTFFTHPSGSAAAERLRIASNGQVSISSDGTTDGLLTIKGDSDQVGTPSIRLLDGSDTREVSITNTSGDFVASVHGNDNAIHGHIKMFESGIFDINNGGASGSNAGRFRIDVYGTTQVNSIRQRLFSANTGSTNGNYWKIGSVTLNGSEGFILTFCGTGGYSAGQQIAASTKVTVRCSNGNTLVGYMTGESSGAACGIDDVRWKHEGSSVFSIWAKVQHYAQITPFVDFFGGALGGWIPDNTNTSSTDVPTSSTAFDKYAYKQVGGTNTIQYTASDTHFLQNVRMANGKGIDFSATANSSGSGQNELLDDYESGAWTPTITGSSSSPTFTYASGFPRGRYIKVGNQVTVWYDIAWSGISGGGGNLKFTNLPFATGSWGYHGFGLMSHTVGTNANANTTGKHMHYANASSDFFYTLTAASTNGHMQISALGTSGHIFGGFTYSTLTT